MRSPSTSNLILYPKGSTHYGLHQTSVTAKYDQGGGRTDQPWKSMTTVLHTVLTAALVVAALILTGCTDGVNGTPVRRATELAQVLAELEPRQTVPVTVTAAGC
jgi:hypothetical protein